jgi:hypothetical protein
MERLLDRFGLRMFHIDRSPISGGAHVVYFAADGRAPTGTYGELMAEEDAARINELESWRSFAAGCAVHRGLSLEELRRWSGRRVVGFGASARSSTYLNWCGFTAGDIAAVIDNNTLKHGRFTAGSRIPIVSMADGLAMRPDLIFILAWNFRDEIAGICRKAGYRGPFLVPFPDRPCLIQDGGVE